MKALGKRYTQPFIIDSFYRYYHHLILIKNKIMQQNVLISGHSADTQLKSIKDIHNELMSDLNKTITTAQNLDWSHGKKHYRSAQYIMAILADEILLNMNWYGQSAWKDHLLEYALFNTSNAGDAFFDEIEKLLQVNNRTDVDLAKLYLITLALGFLGKYRNASAEEILQSYKRELFFFVYGREYDSTSISGPLFDDAYSYTFYSKHTKLRPILSGTTSALLIIVGIYLAVTTTIWHVETKKIKTILNKIDATYDLNLSI